MASQNGTVGSEILITTINIISVVRTKSCFIFPTIVSISQKNKR